MSEDTQVPVYQKLLTSMDGGQNYFLTGAAGVGKSYFVNGFVKEAKKQGKRVVTTSSTGISALQVNGMTIHRLLKFNIQTDKKYVFKMMGYDFWSKLQRDLKNVDIIILDEISMIRSDVLDLIDMLLKKARFDENPFGGISMLFVGDFLQMPPVVKRDENLRGPWAFQAESWIFGNIKVLPLKKVHRQDNPEFINALHDVRLGIQSERAVALLKKCEWNETNEDAVKFVPTNKQAAAINMAKIEMIQGEQKLFEARITALHPSFREKIIKDCVADEKLVLKVGARVMSLVNDKDGIYNNGSLGTVTGFSKSGVFVKLDGYDDVVHFEENKWEHKDLEDRALATFKQVPLKLAYAITIHKSQGMTLDAAEVDCGGIFSAGQLYVALSRVKTPEKLVLRNFRRRQIFASPDALKFYEKHC